MKTIQKSRLIIQLIAIVLFAVGFFTAFRETIMVVMLGGIIFGVYFCGWLCPFGTLQELTSKLGTKLKIHKYKMPKVIHKYLFYSRYLIYGIFTLFTIDILMTLFMFDPRTNFLQLIAGNVITIGSIIVMVSFLFISLFFERPFCNYFCIEGAKYGLISIFRPVTIKRNETSCIGCNKCDKVCPMNIEVSTIEHSHSPHCINCFECVSACPVKDTLTYGPVSLTSKLKTYYVKLVALAIIIGIGFLLYNIVDNDATDQLVDTNKIEIGVNSEETTDSIINEDMSIVDKLKAKANGQGRGGDHHKEAFTGDDNESKTSSTDNSSNTTSSNNESTTSTETSETTNSSTSDNSQIGGASGIADGVYQGEGRGFNGYMTIEITVVNELITKVEVVDHVDDARWFNAANGSIPDQIVDEQSADVNTVSGATYSSRGIIEGANAALEAARN